MTTNNSNTELGWTKRATATALGISTRSFERHCLSDDTFPKPFTIGSTRLWDPDAVRAWRDVKAASKARRTRVVNRARHARAEVTV